MFDPQMFFLGSSPLIVLILMILWLKTPVHYSVLVALGLTLIIAGWYWQSSPSDLLLSSLYGATKGLWPIVIVILGAIYSYNLMQKTGAMEVLKNTLATISDDPRIQVLLIAWCFGGFLEAAAGFGTAVAIPISLLIALGFNPLKAAIASLVANTVPTAFGAVGIPVTILAQQTGLPVTELGGMVIIQLALFNLLLPFVIIAITNGGIRALRGVVFITLMCGIASLVPQYLVAAYIGAELPAFAGSLVSIAVVMWLAKRRPPVQAAEQAPPKTTYRRGEMLRAGSIYLLTFIFILLCSPLFPALKQTVGLIASQFPLALSTGQTLLLKIEWLGTPGVLIILATLTGGAIQGARPGAMLDVLWRTVVQLKNAIIAICAIVAMATVMDTSGMIGDVANSLVAITGRGYVFIAPLIGALGTFVTGSDTNSNVLFGKLQTTAAQQIGTDPLLLAAANTSGATGGKMISPQSISIAVSATRLEGQSSAIMSGVLRYCLIYIVILGFKVSALYYFFY
ncbi:L-lactate permease [Brenneria rubrifaciens]|uniref:L-lactate permease n=1 Tax=Brenneria rubrifaciens TaxID=55213 RepID=A0A4P8QUA3_9GAMM|nr:L-lactate permease [Brenneria rubrifaciens]QCR07745.1 L-lactate permease [Brenneria rubrifaciens]